MQEFISILIDTPWLLTLCVAMVSLCVGSFLNVVIHRMPKKMFIDDRAYCLERLNIDLAGPPLQPFTLSIPASSCPCCQHKIRWYENIPLISWLALRGKCSACKAPISIRYPLVELGTMLASLAVLATFGPSFKMLCGLLLTWVLIALTAIDFDTQLLPDRLTMPLAGLGLLVNVQGLFVSPIQAIWGYVLGFLCLWIVYIIFKVVTGKEGMGYGDFKLLAALGAWLGPMMLPVIVLLSSVVGAVIGIILLKIRKENMPFAFGPYLAIAGWISLIWGPQLLAMYLGTYSQ